MKVFKLILGLGFILALSATTINAQSTPTLDGGDSTAEAVERRAQKQTDNLAKKVELNESQVGKVKDIYIKYGKKEMAARKIEDKKEMSMKMMEIRKGQEEALRGIMNAEQLAKYEEQKAKRSAEMMEKRKKSDAAKRADERAGDSPEKERKPTPAPESLEERAQKKTDKMIEELDLTREQVPQVQEVNMDFYAKMDKKVKGLKDMSKIKEIRQDLNDKRLASLKKILTDEQYQKITNK